LNARKSCDCWLKKFWSAKIPLPFVTAFRFLQLRRKTGVPMPYTVTITFCVSGAITPVLAKHTKHLSLVDVLSIGIDRIQRNFEPMRKQVEAWKGTRLPDETTKLVIYRAFVQGDLDVPKHLVRRVHDLYFNPQIEEFAPRTTWSLSNAFTSAFKELDPIPQFRATAKLASFLESGTTSRN
jgi:hypothetical protein